MVIYNGPIGEPMNVPTCSYINRETAYKIVEQFIRTKKIPTFVKWIDLYDIEFYYDF